MNNIEPPVLHRSRAGYTLLELLVVMVIVGIVATILIGFFVNSYRKTQLRDGAIQLLTDLKQTRSQAQRTSQGSSATLESTSVSAPLNHYTLVWGNGTATPTTTQRYLSSPIRVAPYTTAPINSVPSISYSAPYGEVTGTGIVWEISSTVISSKLYVKAVGVTGKVILSDSPN